MVVVTMMEMVMMIVITMKILLVHSYLGLIPVS